MEPRAPRVKRTLVSWAGERVTMEEQAAPRILRARWLGRIAYREALALQQALAAARAAGSLEEDQLLLLEHDAVLTLGRNAGAEHVLASPGQLAARGIEVVRVERGGEVTYHGPGQLVAYPIVVLAAPGAERTEPGVRPLGVRRFVEALEGAMADTCAVEGISAGPRAGHPGCWVDAAGPLPRKIGALGIRVARGVTFHGIALNVTTNLADFELIDPCGMPGLRSTSLARERHRAGLAGADADAPATTESVAEAAAAFAPAFAQRLGFGLAGDLPPIARAAGERRKLEDLVERLGAPVAAPEPAGAR
jgi:lipoyl(octanoyl) transferase